MGRSPNGGNRVRYVFTRPEPATLKKLSHGETLLLWRRREGMNQLTAAARLGVSPDAYRAWEADRRCWAGPPPKQRLGRLHPRELCVIARRRARLKQWQVAEQVGCSRLWVVQMEDGAAPVDRLAKFWGV